MFKTEGANVLTMGGVEARVGAKVSNTCTGALVGALLTGGDKEGIPVGVDLPTGANAQASRAKRLKMALMLGGGFHSPVDEIIKHQ